MKKLKLLGKILRITHADKILLSYLAFVFIDALIIMIFDKGINSYFDSLWYCCVVIFTVGFGDLVATSLIARIASVVLMVYSAVVLAIITGVFVNFYNELVKTKNKETLSNFVSQLERLPELSKDELTELSQKVKKFKG